MKKLLWVFAPLVLLQGCQSDVLTDPLWETGGLRTPESVLYFEGAEERVLLVSEIDEEGQGGIAQLSIEGEILDQDWVRGLQGPKGMGVHNGKLYVSDITEVAVIDIASQTVENRIPIEGSSFLNDVTVDDQGAVYVSDSETGMVHRIADGTPEVYLRELPGANGLTFVDGVLYLGAGPTLYRVDENRQLTTVAEGFDEGIDGVEMIAEGEFIISCWRGLMYHVRPDGSFRKLLDTRKQEKNTADIGWNPRERVVYVPTFFKNSVVAYSLADAEME